MQIIQDKRALSSFNYGHQIFAIMLLVMGILILLQFTKIPILTIIQNNFPLFLGMLIVYLIFSVFVDKVLEKPGQYNHHGFFHSLTCLMICFVLVPVTIEKYFINANGYWLIATAGLCGHLSHLAGDALCTRLKW